MYFAHAQKHVATVNVLCTMTLTFAVEVQLCVSEPTKILAKILQPSIIYNIYAVDAVIQELIMYSPRDQHSREILGKSRTLQNHCDHS